VLKRDVKLQTNQLCLLATLRKNFQIDLHEIFRADWQWANEQMIKFWCQSGCRPSGCRELVSWSLTSLFSTSMAISETKGQGWKVIRTH